MKEFIYTNRLHYDKDELTEDKISYNPFEQFNWWFSEAIEAKITEPYACNFASAGKDGRVSSRIVLIRGFDEDGFIFFTNYKSAKGKQIAENNFGALTFFWEQMQRQIRIEGIISKVDAKESDEYFASRPREHQIGAWVSNQSEVIADRKVLQKKYDDLVNDYEGKEIPRPEHWGGYTMQPDFFEFWQGRLSRLHDRISYKMENNIWKISRLSP